MHIELDHYARMSTPIHTWDVRHKVCVVSFFVLSSSFFTSIGVLGIASVLSMIVLLIARIPLGYVVRRLRYPFMFIGGMAGILMVTAGGAIAFRFAGIPFYVAGINTGMVVVLRSGMALLLFFSLLETAPFSDTVAALYALRVPKKLVGIIFFTYRFIYQYLETFRKMRISLRLRGYRNTLCMQGIRTNAGIVGSMLIRSFEQAEQVCAAMMLRGYTGRLPFLRTFRAGTSDYLKSGILVGVLVMLWGYEWMQ